MKIGRQITESLIMHLSMDKGEAKDTALALLTSVGIPEPAQRLEEYPHQLSGGMRQRVTIAIALACGPKLLFADEPTTALDVTVQAQILELMKDLQREFGSAIIIITHDLGVVADVADDIMVMYAGRAVEKGSVKDVFYQPQHPYTWGLLQSMPRLDQVRKTRLDPIPGNPPSLINLPTGCKFNPRCGYQHEVADSLCTTREPDLFGAGTTSSARCHIDPARRTQIALELFGAKK
jgi:peptide/nickel transport system ATP-binding protein